MNFILDFWATPAFNGLSWGDVISLTVLFLCGVAALYVDGLGRHDDGRIQ